jgi:hypothetical protein
VGTGPGPLLPKLRQLARPGSVTEQIEGALLPRSQELEKAFNTSTRSFLKTISSAKVPAGGNQTAPLASADESNTTPCSMISTNCGAGTEKQECRPGKAWKKSA